MSLISIGTHLFHPVGEQTVTYPHYKCEHCGLLVYCNDGNWIISGFFENPKLTSERADSITCNEIIVREVIE